MRLSRYWMTGCMALVLMGVSPMMRAKDGESERDERGWVSVVSKYSPQQTLAHLEREARAQGFSIFARWPLGPKAGGQGAADGETRAQVLVLGSEPDLTPIVQGGAGSDIQLPLEVIVSPRPDGTSRVLIQNLAALTRDQDVPPEWARSVAGLPAVVDRALA